MLTQTEFQQWCRELQLSPTACDHIAGIRAAPPTRRVSSRANNVSGAYPSRKMGVTIQFESHKVELWAVYLMEHDAEVLEFYDQPQTFKLLYQDKTGKRTLGHYHTPDFLVLRKHGVGFEEWKMEEELRRQAEKQPFRYHRAEDGTWHCPPGEAYAESCGLSYRVRSSAELHRTYIENLVFLEDYVRFLPTVPQEAQVRILEWVRETPGIPLSAFVSEGSGVRANDVYAMLAQEVLYTDLYAVPLIHHARVHLYLDMAQAQAYAHLKPSRLHQQVGAPFPERSARLSANTTLLWDGRPWTVVNPGETTTTLLPETGQPLQVPSSFFFELLETRAITILRTDEETPSHPEADRLMAEASPADMRLANERFRLVTAYINHRQDIYEGATLRTLRRWVSAFHDAEVRFGSGYVGLLPHTARRGNRTPKAPHDARALLDAFITEHYETPRQAPAASVYRAYVQACTTRSLAPLSPRAFYYRLKQPASPEQTERRKGVRAAYQETPWFWELEYATPRHGTRPFEIVHIDHTPLDIELRLTRFWRGRERGS